MSKEYFFLVPVFGLIFSIIDREVIDFALYYRPWIFTIGVMIHATTFILINLYVISK